MLDTLIHASCVAFDGRGVLLAGDPGAGKSEIALCLIEAGAKLVSDDQTALHVENGRLIAAPPASIAGLIEVRHVGLLRLPYCPSAPVMLYVDLVPDTAKLERMPESERVFLLDQPVRRLSLSSHESATPVKIRAALLYETVE
ncbi:MAG: HPr kinase/phosphatase C-terminal domain-containing protein [Alphaproteobacteria bacterium]|nr:HPr kinase/phosphatase C-terminal domain-containing protein [Alphaproteobacteria bacterium]